MGGGGGGEGDERNYRSSLVQISGKKRRHWRQAARCPGARTVLVLEVVVENG